MTKISSLPKASSSSNNDLIVVVQGGKTKHISKEAFLGAIESLSAQNASNIQGLQNKISKRTINKNSPVFTSPVKAGNPSEPNHLTTKEYVDKEFHNVLRDDGVKKLTAPLSFLRHPSSFSPKDLISKQYADNLLLGVLKNIVRYKGELYPSARAGDSFIFEVGYDAFAEDGPEIQVGDLLICIENSEGGTQGSVGHQFAILNTNITTSNESTSGIIKVATSSDMDSYVSDNTAVTPLKYKEDLDNSSLYNRTLIEVSSYTATENDRGILAIDNRKTPTTLTLPSVKSLKNPAMFKLTVKDEFGQATAKNIVIKSSESTIDGKASITLSNKYQAVTLYNDGKDYYIENNTHTDGVLSGNSIQAGLVKPAAAGVTSSLFSSAVDLTQFDVAQGFKVTASGNFSATANTKTIKLSIGGITTVTNATTTAPNAKSFVASVTILKAPKYAVAYGALLLDGIAADTFSVYSLDLDWTSEILVEITALAATASTDIYAYSFVVEPLK